MRSSYGTAIGNCGVIPRRPTSKMVLKPGAQRADLAADEEKVTANV